MPEHLLNSEKEEPRLSRRKVLKGVAGAALMGASGAAWLHEGIVLSPPKFEIQTVHINKDPDDMQLVSLEDDGSESRLTLLTTGEKLLYEPSGDFFNGQPINYIHRGGNSYEAIDESIRRLGEEGRDGPLLLDIDLNIVDGDKIIVEHGIVYKIAGMFWFVFDANEGEMRIGGINTYQEILEFIKERSVDLGIDIGVSTEIKRGDCPVNVLHKIIGVNQRYKIPGRIHSPRPGEFSAIREEIAMAQGGV